MASDLPKEIKIVQFGPGESKEISEYHSYVKCVDADTWGPPQNSFSLKAFLNKAVTYIKRVFGLVGDAPGCLGDYGQITCNHSSVIMNRQFVDYFRNLMVSYENEVEGGEEPEFDEEGVEKAVFECFPVTCHEDYDGCFDAFVKLVYKK